VTCKSCNKRSTPKDSGLVRRAGVVKRIHTKCFNALIDTPAPEDPVFFQRALDHSNSITGSTKPIPQIPPRKEVKTNGSTT
jgi:hypothetical protein